MELQGRVQNGVVVLDGQPALPEGAVVVVTYPAPDTASEPVNKQRIQLPLVRSEQPGSVQLSGAKIAEILNDEDATSGR